MNGRWNNKLHAIYYGKVLSWHPIPKTIDRLNYLTVWPDGPEVLPLTSWGSSRGTSKSATCNQLLRMITWPQIDPLATVAGLSSLQDIESMLVPHCDLLYLIASFYRWSWRKFCPCAFLSTRTQSSLSLEWLH